MDKPCPFCGALLQPWRFRLVEEIRDEWPAVIEAHAMNPDLDPEHALYHVPTEF